MKSPAKTLRATQRIVTTFAALLSLCASSVSALTLGVRAVVNGLSGPVAIASAEDHRLFVVEQAGRIRIIENGMLLDESFLDIEPLILSGGERGLLGLAFHPDYAVEAAAGEGFFWVNYTNGSGDTVIARYSVSAADPNIADPDSARVLLTIDQTSSNHNGGQLQFGPVEGLEGKRYLYIGMGDGGGSGDPNNAGQIDTTVLGKLLRIDPSTVNEPVAPFYSIPPDNPNPAAGFELGMIWAKGLRNPWRYSFDALTGDLYLADVGQELREEINLTPAGSPGGLNYGWRIMEGQRCYDPATNCDTETLTLPVFDYAQEAGRCAIIGGYVYRGSRYASLQGVYLYADFCSREVFRLDKASPGVWEGTRILTTPFRPLTFGEDANGELYIGGNDGSIYQIVDLDGEASLKAGLTWYSPPVQVADGFTCGELRRQAMSTMVARLNPVSQQVETCNVAGDSFLVRGGEGYLLAIPDAVSFTMQGLPECPLIDMKTGLNLIGVPSARPGTGCFDLLGRFGSDVIASIQRLNPSTETVESCAYRSTVPAAIAEGISFPIVPGTAYLISMRKAQDAVGLHDATLCTPQIN